ncbi:sulfotransferase domain-containing protein [Roseinatronobacter bogoriensis]|uniref:Sulfotransferase domain-containing protein n=1 Tax=Roseinatronobacter bogoriensis subsp. barguzinensis TaxID=441209 RepID=A0A2K8KLS5_9RHOB|nr:MULTISPECIES: sulfotransferase domain-containing protein [Rhodobaca]ATX67500.1 hypothetical protein BG454_18165 [Rhodobaca barguzinensis]MBB4207093.1 hypothetical protein [Rhodobaca bogoriensis DSM 18756]TDW35976.1 sulfotransferase domain-containing protein [Rhodobaca barguzinensis]TDY73989.1 sulfotransferase domain-containing protein [Rhodobaca bogoriensis DSM 18756]
MKSILLLTSATSGTLSMQRIINILVNAENAYTDLRYFDTIKNLPPEQIVSAIPPEQDHILLNNSPIHWNVNLDLSNYRTVVNFRDPRDRICNVYHWKLVHPSSETPEVRERRIQETIEMGMDQWVAQNFKKRGYDNAYYENLFHALERGGKEHCIAITYARLCLDFTSLKSQLADFLGVTLTPAQEKLLEAEQPETVTSNPKWIGNRWAGSDVMPGRYKHELSEDNIASLNAYYAPTLRLMAKHDPDFAHTYLDGIE